MTAEIPRKRIRDPLYGFNRDDDHVTNMVHDAMRKNKGLLLKIFSRDDMAHFAGIQRLKEEFDNRVVIICVGHNPEESGKEFSKIFK